MKILDRYIGTSVAKGYLVVVAVLLPIFSFFVFVDELEDVGKGTYRSSDAFLYVVLTAPARVLELAPITALLGSIIALGGLAAGSELVVIRAAGVSIMRLGGAVLKTGLALMLLVVIFGQFVVPYLNQYAETRRSEAITEAGTFLKGKGFWSKDGSRYANVSKVRHGRVPVGIDVYEFDDDGRLRVFIRAGRAVIEEEGEWKLIDVWRKQFDGRDILNEHLPELHWKPFLSKTQVRVLELPPQSLSPSDLYQYARHLRETGQAAEQMELRFWQQAFLPVATGAMALLSLPFLFGTIRSASFGKRLALGGMFGVAFYLLNQIVANLGLLVGISPPIVAGAPVLALLAGTLLVMRQVR